MDAALALAGLAALLIFARSIRGGFSGPVARFISLTLLPGAGAALWLLALTVEWWALALFVLTSIVVGLLVNRRNLGAWVSMEPISGGVGLLLIAGAWFLRLAI